VVVAEANDVAHGGEVGGGREEHGYALISLIC